MPPLLLIDHHNGVPAYRQIIDQVRLQVTTGVLPEGTEMPSTRALASTLTLNPMTVSKAYSLLEHDGILERRRGQTLTVRAQATGSEDPQARLEPLRQQLEAATRLARQLEIPDDEVLRLLRQSLKTTFRKESSL
jgi:GntR family transcriptional regulator